MTRAVACADVRQIYRHSFYARWEVCSLESFDCQDLVADEDSSGDVRLVVWSPQNKIVRPSSWAPVAVLTTD